MQVSSQETRAAELLQQATQQHTQQQQQEQAQRELWAEDTKAQLEKSGMLSSQISSLREEKVQYEALLLVLRQQVQIKRETHAWVG
jgi:hypothetical protein